MALHDVLLGLPSSLLMCGVVFPVPGIGILQA